MKVISRNRCLYFPLFLLLILVMPFASKAQDRGEISVFGGYSYLNDVFSSKHGWNASLAGNVTRHVALVADFSGHYGPESWFQSANRNYSFLFGPRYVYTIGKRWTPFAHALIGNFWETQNIGGSPAVPSGSTSTNWLALDLGGGVDIRMSSRISVRALQLDIVRISNGNSHDHYGRVSFGAVFRLTGVPNE